MPFLKDLNIVLLSLSYFSSYGNTFLQILLVLRLANSFITYAVQSSINAIDPPSLILCYTRLALKKRNRISIRGNPQGNPTQGKFFTLDINLLTIIYTFLLMQKLYTYLTISSLLSQSFQQQLYYNVIIYSFNVKQD